MWKATCSYFLWWPVFYLQLCLSFCPSPCTSPGGGQTCLRPIIYWTPLKLFWINWTFRGGANLLAARVRSQLGQLIWRQKFTCLCCFNNVSTKRLLRLTAGEHLQWSMNSDLWDCFEAGETSDCWNRQSKHLRYWSNYYSKNNVPFFRTHINMARNRHGWFFFSC